MSTHAIVLLKEDHEQIRRLFSEFREAGANAAVTKEKLVTRIIERLTVHTFLENEIMYAEVRNRLPELEDEVLESMRSTTSPTFCVWSWSR